MSYADVVAQKAVASEKYTNYIKLNDMPEYVVSPN